ncbi:MAG: alpha/beta fold hydrolase [Burkholderiaceae bacterium]
MQISANGIAIEVEDHGPASAEPLLLIMGLGMQLTGWPDGFVGQLVRRGFRVIRFDNRDAGLSHAFDELGVPHVALASMQYLLHWPIKSAYGLADMARDALGVLDALGIARAHVCGASMGGMIAQHLAFDHAARVRSLALMMTSSGARSLPQPSMKLRGALISRPENPSDFDSIVAHNMMINQLIASPGYPTPEPQLRQRIESYVRRSNRPQGLARQLVAIVADGSRAERLAGIAAPTQVIHGQADPLVAPQAGQQLARLIPSARLDLIDGMGHDLPEALWPRFVAAIHDNARRAAS